MGGGRGGNSHLQMMSKSPYFFKSSCLSNGRVGRCLGAPIAAFCLTVLVLVTILSINSIAPFGDGSSSLATNDAQIQYLDFFAYLKNVLAGNDSVRYTLGKGLGGTGIAVFSYYLSSPFNLLFLPFPDEWMPAVYDVIVVLKLALASALASVFLSRRFATLDMVPNISLAISYGLMQYSIAQSCNIMWLDGVYLLPLMLLGAYRVARGNGPVLLVSAAGISILFNWYSGAINCIFVVIWFLFEMALLLMDERGSAREAAWLLLRRSLSFALAMALAVGVGAVMLFPTALSLSGGRASGGWLSFDFDLWYGNPLNVIKQSVIGSVSSKSNISIYCGGIALLGAVSALVYPTIPTKKRGPFFVLLAIMVVALYWQPLVALFSLFKSATSYYSRYSYLTIACVVFAAGWFYSEASSQGGTLPRRVMMLSAAALCLLFVVLIFSGELSLSSALIVTVTSVVGEAVVLLVGWRFRDKGYYWPALLVLVVVSVELGVNAHMLVNKGCSVENVRSRAEYVSAQAAQVDSLRKIDDTSYRVSQTGTWYMRPGGRTANYNEGLGFGYASVQTYTSDPVDSQRAFLDRMGYAICGENMNIVDSSLIGIDSVLGVKYVFSSEDLGGLQPVDGLPEANGKKVYENPYALPLAFTWPGKDGAGVSFTGAEARDSSNENNPFECQNDLWSQLLGREVDLYTPVAYDIEPLSGEDGGVQVVAQGIPRDSLLYANVILKNRWSPSTIVVGDKELSYSQWLAPSVFAVPPSSDGTAGFIFEQDAPNEIAEIQFYQLDLGVLEEASATLREGVDEASYSVGGHMTVQAWAQEGEELLVTVPLSSGWTISVNGEEVSPKEAFGCFVSIPLQSGLNKVEMTYSVPGLVAGGVTSAASVAVLGIVALRTRLRGVQG